MDLGRILGLVSENSVTKEHHAVIPCSEISLSIEMLSEKAYNYLFEQEDVLDISCDLIHDGIAHNVRLALRTQDGVFTLGGW